MKKLLRFVQIMILVALVATFLPRAVPAEAQCRTNWVGGESPNCDQPPQGGGRPQQAYQPQAQPTGGTATISWNQLSLPEKNWVQTNTQISPHTSYPPLPAGGALFGTMLRSVAITIVGAVSAVGAGGSFSLAALATAAGGPPGAIIFLIAFGATVGIGGHVVQNAIANAPQPQPAPWSASPSAPPSSPAPYQQGGKPWEYKTQQAGTAGAAVENLVDAFFKCLFEGC